MKRIIPLLCKIGLSILLFVSFISLSGFKILDPEADNKFFKRLSLYLDDIGIDIIQSWESNVKLEGRPTLAPIANYNVSVLERETDWTQAFASSYANAIVALQTEQPVEAAKFVEQWEATSVDKRVFISFTKDDIAHAENIKKVLEDVGYKVFIYAETGRAPFTSPEMIAHCMKSAGEVLILDTENSRGKVGVLAEALTFAKYTYRSEKDILAENELLKTQLKAEMEKVYSPLEISAKKQLKSEIEIQLVENLVSYYKEERKTVITKVKAKEIINKRKANIRVISDNVLAEYDRYLAKNKEYLAGLFDNIDSSPFGYNKKLNAGLSSIQKSTLSSVMAGFRYASDQASLPFGSIRYLGICPWYKIPIVLCPICTPLR